MNCVIRKFIKILISVVVCSLCLFINSSAIKSVNKPVYNSSINTTKRIALTFDDGPHPRRTLEIIKVLDKYDVKATFFVLGVNVKNYPETMMAVMQKGHEIANHTFSHHILKDKALNGIQKEIFDTETEINRLNGKMSNLIRPPCGLYDESLVDYAIENDYKIVLWNIDTHDWAHESTEYIVNKVLTDVKGGDIILFHDYTSGENNTSKALNILIPKLESLGYEFVTVGELLQDM